MMHQIPKINCFLSCRAVVFLHWSLVLSGAWRYIVGPAPTGGAPTTSEWSTILLPTKAHFILEVWRYLFFEALNGQLDNKAPGVCCFLTGSSCFFQAVNGQLDMAALCVEPDKCFFHADDSGRILHIGANEIRLVRLNTLRPRQNGCHFPNDIFKWIFLNKNVWTFI